MKRKRLQFSGTGLVQTSCVIIHVGSAVTCSQGWKYLNTWEGIALLRIEEMAVGERIGDFRTFSSAPVSYRKTNILRLHGQASNYQPYRIPSGPCRRAQAIRFTAIKGRWPCLAVNDLTRVIGNPITSARQPERVYLSHESRIAVMRLTRVLLAVLALFRVS